MENSLALVEAETYLGAARFVDIHEIGRGALGVVYQAHDRLLGEDVALKALIDGRSDEALHLKQEFRTLVQFSHTNLIRLHQLFARTDGCFFTMELLEGFSLTEYLRGTAPDGGALVWDDALRGRIRVVLQGFIDGLGALHREGVFHRDVKPLNVKITRGGRLVLLDFGFAIRGLDATEPGELVGTLVYMAPEQALGSPSSASDWYSVGASLYEALSGVAPFEGRGSEVLRQKLRGPPRPIRKLSTSLPHALANLIDELLATTPERRAGEAAVRAWLEQASGAPQRQSVPSPGRPFINREAELRELMGHLQAVAGGATKVVHVVGPSGIGKSEFLRHFLVKARNDPGAFSLSGRCHTMESVAFNAFDGIIDTLSVKLQRMAPLKGPMADDIARLARLFPVLRPLAGVQVLRDGQEEPREMRRACAEALRRLLRQLSAPHPLMVWIDDMQWSDADSLALLRELLAGNDSAPMLLVCTYRAEDVRGETLIKVRTDPTLGGPDGPAVMVLHPLAEADAQSLVARLLPSRFAEIPGMMDGIVRAGAGSPFMLSTLALHGVTEAEPGDVQSVSLDFPATLRAQTSGLSSAEQDLLEFVAVAGRPLPMDLTLEVAGLGDRGRAGVNHLTQSNLLRRVHTERGEALETYHDQVRESVVRTLPAEKLRARHLALAGVLARNDAQVDAAAWHYQAGGDHAAAASTARGAAERAAAALAFDRAAELYGLALQGVSRPSDRAPLLERRALVLAQAGRGREAAENYAAAAEALDTHAPGSTWSVELRQHAGAQFLRSGHYKRGMDLMQRAVQDVGVDFPTSTASLLLGVVRQRGRLLLRGYKPGRRRASVIPDEARRRLDVLWSACASLAMVRPSLADYFGVRHLLDVLDHGMSERIARVLAYEATCEAGLGGGFFRRRSDDLLARASEAAARTGDPYDLAWSHLGRGSCGWFRADWDSTVRACDAGAALFQQGRGVAWEIATCEVFSLSALAFMGDLAALAQRLPGVQHGARTRDDVYALNNARLGQQSIHWLAMDQVGAWRTLAREAEQQWHGDTFHLQRYNHLVAVAQADLYEGEGWRAFERIAAAWTRLRDEGFLSLQLPRTELGHLRARTALAALRGALDGRAMAWPSGTPARLKALVRAEIRSLKGNDLPIATPYADGLTAGLHAVQGETGRAKASLTRAAAGFQRVGMQLYAAAARHAAGEVQDASGPYVRVANARAMTAMLMPGAVRTV